MNENKEKYVKLTLTGDNSVTVEAKNLGPVEILKLFVDASSSLIDQLSKGKSSVFQIHYSNLS